MGAIPDRPLLLGSGMAPMSLGQHTRPHEESKMVSLTPQGHAKFDVPFLARRP
jgi:hypothetical protein